MSRWCGSLMKLMARSPMPSLVVTPLRGQQFVEPILVTDNFMHVVAELISRNTCSPQAKVVELPVVDAAPQFELSAVTAVLQTKISLELSSEDKINTIKSHSRCCSSSLESISLWQTNTGGNRSDWLMPRKQMPKSLLSLIPAPFAPLALVGHRLLNNVTISFTYMIWHLSLLLLVAASLEFYHQQPGGQFDHRQCSPIGYAYVKD